MLLRHLLAMLLLLRISNVFMNITSINLPMLKTDLNDQVIHILSQQEHQQHSFQC